MLRIIESKHGAPKMLRSKRRPMKRSGIYGRCSLPRSEHIKATTLVALSVLIILWADVGQRHRQIGSPTANCNNNGHCTIVSTTTPVPFHKSRPEAQNAIAAVPHQSHGLDANGNKTGVVTSSKTGARARVGIRYAERFQAYIDDLENNYGARVLFMGGMRRGRCSTSSEHPCGKALDVCQLRRGVVDPRCHLPGRIALARIAASHGLFEGGRWCNSDYGHAQIDVTAADCGERRARIVRHITMAPVKWAQIAPHSYGHEVSADITSSLGNTRIQP